MYENIIDDLRDVIDDLENIINNDTRIDFDVEDFKWELEKNGLLINELEMFIDRYIGE